MNMWKRLCAFFAKPVTVDYGPCKNCKGGRIEQKGEFRCYGCWNADNYDAGW